ncbi:MAG: hypothetical protein AAF658_02260, partial [Myxococcota bacterium]
LVLEAALVPTIRARAYRQTVIRALATGLQAGFAEVTVAKTPPEEGLALVIDDFRPAPIKTGNVPLGPDVIRSELRFDIDYQVRLQRGTRVLARSSGNFAGLEQSWREGDLLPMLGRTSHRALRAAASVVFEDAVLRPAELASRPRDKGEAEESIALLPLRGPGLPESVTSVLDELLIVSMDERSPHRIVSMADINALLDHEQLKDALGCDDVTCATEIGGALGVDFIVTGQAGILGDTLVVTLHQVRVADQTSESRSKATVLNEPSLYPQAIEVAVERLQR